MAKNFKDSRGRFTLIVVIVCATAFFVLFSTYVLILMNRPAYSTTSRSDELRRVDPGKTLDYVRILESLRCLR